MTDPFKQLVFIRQKKLLYSLTAAHALKSLFNRHIIKTCRLICILSTRYFMVIKLLAERTVS